MKDVDGHAARGHRQADLSAARDLSLDGLRAFAVAAVLIWHGFPASDDPWTWMQVWRLGPLGVRLFFVLSGFLITGILVRARIESQNTGRAGIWRAFMLRRAVRIFPLAYLALACATLAGLPPMRQHGWWYWSYTSNLWGGVHDPGVAHFWSLAVEEQFYLAWPVLVLWSPRHRLPAVMLVVVVLSVCARMLVAALVGPDAAYTWTLTRLDALAFGGWMAVAAPRWRSIGVIGLLLLCASMLLPLGPAFAGVSESAGVLLCGTLLITVRDGFGRRLLEWRPLRYLGTISYGIYVWHMMVPLFIHQIEQALNIWLRLPEEGMLRFGYTAVVTIALAALSWHFYEAPLNRLKRYIHYVPRVAHEAESAQKKSEQLATPDAIL